MGNNCSKVKRMACIMLSAISIANPSFGFIGGVSNAWGGKKSGTATAKENVEKEIKATLKKLNELYRIIVEENIDKKFSELSKDDQELFKGFCTDVFSGGRLYGSNAGIKDVARGTLNVVNNMIQTGATDFDPRRSFCNVLPSTFHDDHEIVLPCEYEGYKDKEISFMNLSSSTSSFTVNSYSGPVGKKSDGSYMNLSEYEKEFWNAMYEFKCREQLKPVLDNCLRGSISANEGIVKQILTNPLVIFLGAVIGLKFSGDIAGGLRNIGKEAYYFGKKLWSKATAKGIDLKNYQECLERIETRLRTELVGEDDAIERIIDIMRGYFQSMVEAEINKEKFEGGLLLYLMGPSATGKSTTMKIIQEEMKLSNLTIRMANVTDETNSKANNVASRLLQPTFEEAGKRKITIESPLLRQLKNYVPTLYLFDEVDKMRKLDAQLSKSKLGDCNTINSIDELFRNFVDTGHIGGINASGSVLITTSNETMDDINRLDPSLANRYRPYIVEFRNFDENDYIEIIKRGFVTLQKNYMNTDKVKLEITDQALRYFARKFVQERAGGRCAEPLMMQMRSAIVVFCKENDIKNRGLLLDVDTNTGKISPKLVEKIDDTIAKANLKKIIS